MFFGLDPRSDNIQKSRRCYPTFWIESRNYPDFMQKIDRNFILRRIKIISLDMVRASFTCTYQFLLDFYSVLTYTNLDTGGPGAVDR